MLLFLVPYSFFFLYFIALGDVCPGASPAAKGPRSQVPACLRDRPEVRGAVQVSPEGICCLSDIGHHSGQWHSLQREHRKERPLHHFSGLLPSLAG